MGMPGKDGPPGDPGYPGLKGEMGRRGECWRIWKAVLHCTWFGLGKISEVPLIQGTLSFLEIEINYKEFDIPLLRKIPSADILSLNLSYFSFVSVLSLKLNFLWSTYTVVCTTCRSPWPTRGSRYNPTARRSHSPCRLTWSARNWWCPWLWWRSGIPGPSWQTR